MFPTPDMGKQGVCPDSLIYAHRAALCSCHDWNCLITQKESKRPRTSGRSGGRRRRGDSLDTYSSTPKHLPVPKWVLHSHHYDCRTSKPCLPKAGHRQRLRCGPWQKDHACQSWTRRRTSSPRTSSTNTSDINDCERSPLMHPHLCHLSQANDLPSGAGWTLPTLSQIDF